MHVTHEIKMRCRTLTHLCKLSKPDSLFCSALQSLPRRLSHPYDHQHHFAGDRRLIRRLMMI